MKQPRLDASLLCVGLLLCASALHGEVPAVDIRPISPLELLAEVKSFEIREIEKQAEAAVPRLIASESAPTPKLADPSLVASEKVVTDQGRTVTVQRLTKAPPLIVKSATTVQTQPRPSSPLREPFAPDKPHHTLFLSCTVYDHTLTQLRWFEEGLEYRVFVNFDFTLFRGIGHIESEKATYSLVLGIGEASLEDEILMEKYLVHKGLPLESIRRMPDLQLFPLDKVLIHPGPGTPPDLEKTAEYQALPELLAQAQKNEKELRWNQAVLQAENAARKRWLEANPRRPENVVIQFWPVAKPANRSATK